MSIRSMLGYITTVCLAVFVAVLLAEGILRAIGVSARLPYLPNPFFGWSHTPDDRYTNIVEGRHIDVTINSKGLRDFDYSYDKRDGEYRILALGDSFAEALQVDLTKSFTKIVEALLNSGLESAQHTVSVINSGTSGYGTDNELLFFRHEGRKYNPDIVILAMYIGNDIRNNWHELENIDVGGHRKPYFVLSDGSLSLKEYPFEGHRSVLTRLKVAMNRHSRLYVLARQVRDRMRKRTETPENTPTGSHVDLDMHAFSASIEPAWQNAFAVTEKLLLALDAEASENSAQLIVVLIPTQFQVHVDYWRSFIDSLQSSDVDSWDVNKPNSVLVRFMNENDISYIDLLPDLRRATERYGDEFYLVNDKHWNELGHELAAQIIVRELRQLLLSLSAD